MNFQKLLNVADSNRAASLTEASVKRYSTVLAPPKKPPKSNVQSEAIKRFLAKKEKEERQKALEEQRKKDELLCLRSQNTKNSKKAKIMASRTKDNDFSRIRMTEDEVVAKKEREAKLLRMSLNNKVERMKARIEMEEKEKLLPHKRKRKSKIDSPPGIEMNENNIHLENRRGEQNNSTFRSQEAFNFHSNTELSSKEAHKRMRAKLPAAGAPPVNFDDLLKIAATKQYQPIELPVVEVSDTEERPLTKREKSLLLAEKMRSKRKIPDDEQNLSKNKIVPSEGKSKLKTLNGKHVQHVNRTPGLLQELSKSNGNLLDIGDRKKLVPHINDFQASKQYHVSSSENTKPFTANKSCRSISGKSNSPKTYMNQQGAITSDNFSNSNFGRNSSEHRFQDVHETPIRQKVMNKISDNYMHVQNGQRTLTTDAVKKSQPPANKPIPKKVPHSNPQQNVLFKSASMGNISGSSKNVLLNSGNSVNSSKGRNSTTPVIQYTKTPSQKTLSEYRPNNYVVGNSKKSAVREDLVKSASFHHRSSNDLLLDKSNKLSKLSAISSSREIHLPATHKNSVISTKVPGKLPNIKAVIGNSYVGDSSQHRTTSDIRLKNSGELLFQSQKKTQNVRRDPEDLLTKTKGNLSKSSLQECAAPVRKFNAKSEMGKKPALSSAKVAPIGPRISSSEFPPARPPSSLKSSAGHSSSAVLPVARPAMSAKLPPPRPSIKSAYPRNPYLDPPRRLLESHRPQKMPMKRRIESDDDEEEDDMSDFIDDGPTDDPADVSKYIKEIFNYDRSTYADDDDDDIVETTFAEQMKEEVRSAKLGLLEDLEDMRKEEEEKKRKKKKMKK